MNKTLEYIFLFLVFPGFLFSAAMGLLVGWVDRKVTARLQWRAGPPWYQNFLDVLKLLFYKETLVPPAASKAVFFGMPVLAVSSAALVSMTVLIINHSPGKGFMGDVIVIAYLMLIPSIALMLGAFASANPLASLGASREMKMMLSYELPFIMALVIVMIRCGHAIRLGDIMIYQRANGSLIGSLSGAVAFVVMLLSVHAKMGFIPFDAPEAETEIISGPYIEYSGKALGMFKLSKAITLFTVPVFLISLYFGGIRFDMEGALRCILQYLSILVSMIVIKNTNPRLRIDQAVRFFWGPVTGLAAIGIALACVGR